MGGTAVPLIGQGAHKAPSPLLRSNLLGFVAMLDAVLTVSLVLFSIKGNIWTALFPIPWLSQEAMATGLGDILILLALRWAFTTSAGTGAACILSQSGVAVMSGTHLLATFYLASKIACAIDLAKLPRGVSVHTHIAVAVCSIVAMWLEFLLMLRSLGLLRLQLRADQMSSSRFRSGTEMWHTSPDVRQPLLTGEASDPEASSFPEEVPQPDMHTDPEALEAALRDAALRDVEDMDMFEDARSEVSFQSATSAQTSASFASAATHLTSASYVTARTHRTMSTPSPTKRR